MFPAIKRAILTPFINHRRKVTLLKSMRTPIEIINQSNHFHAQALEWEKKGKKDTAKELQVMADTLRWVLRIESNATSK